MFGKTSIMFAVFICCESAFIDTLGKCSVKNNECQRELYTKSIKAIAKSGLPEYDIPPFDPFVIKNRSVSILNLVDITMVDGVAKNLKSCFFNRIDTTIEKFHSTMEVTCNITIKGHYTASSVSPLVRNLLGGSSVHGDGIGKVKIENLHITFDFDFFLRESDGEIFFDCKHEHSHYKYDIEKVSFAATNLYIGEQEVGQLVTSMLNENWQFIMTTFGQFFIDAAMHIVYETNHKFFDVTPARFFILEDLSKYYKN